MILLDINFLFTLNHAQLARALEYTEFFFAEG